MKQIANVHPDSVEQFNKFCNKHRTKKHLGNGRFADVYQRKDNAIKIGPINDAYLTYAKTIFKKKKHNPLTPKIYQITIVHHPLFKSESMYIIEMEKLNKHRKFDGWGIDTVISQYSWEPIGGRLKGIVKKLMPKKMTKQLINDIKEVSTIIKGCRKRTNGNYDFHSGNIMFRNDHVVFIDPLWRD